MISFSNINKQYGKQLLFVDASFQLNPSEKVGLVGPNGAGKTTLFRMVVGEETPDEGTVSVPKKLTIGYFRPSSNLEPTAVLRASSLHSNSFHLIP
jgi:ATPase subunit of ABC transporter with duplicated ATPase domains